MQFAYRVAANGAGGWLATFADVPEAITEAGSKAELAESAADALATALLGYMKDGLDLPRPGSVGRDDIIATLPIQIVAKLELYDAFRQSGLTRVALARRLAKDESEVRRMLDPYHATKLPALEAALKSLGKRVTLVVDAA